MTWTVKNDSLYHLNLGEIGYFPSNTPEKERKMIKKGDELFTVVGLIINDYDEGKGLLKKKFDMLEKLIDKASDYNVSWTKTAENELINEKDKLIFIFITSDANTINTIKLLPDLYYYSQQLLNNFLSSNPHKLKEWYNKICDLYENCWDY